MWVRLTKIAQKTFLTVSRCRNDAALQSALTGYGMKISNLLYRLSWVIPRRFQLQYLLSLGKWNKSVDPEMSKLHTIIPKSRRAVALDIGANNGVTSLLMSRVFEKVYSFEPNPSLLGRWAYLAPSNVECVLAAVSDVEGTAPLRIPVLNNVELTGWASLADIKIGTESRVIEVETITCDTFFKKCNVSQIDFIKIDVEGHERAALQGAVELIKKNLPWILAETNFGPQELAKLLIPFGYVQIDQSNSDVVGLRDFSKQNTLFVPANECNIHCK